jgi:hypothetical protein
MSSIFDINNGMFAGKVANVFESNKVKSENEKLDSDITIKPDDKLSVTNPEDIDTEKLMNDVKEEKADTIVEVHSGLTLDRVLELIQDPEFE